MLMLNVVAAVVVGGCGVDVNVDVDAHVSCGCGDELVVDDVVVADAVGNFVDDVVVVVAIAAVMFVAGLLLKLKSGVFVLP